MSISIEHAVFGATLVAALLGCKRGDSASTPAPSASAPMGAVEAGAASPPQAGEPSGIAGEFAGAATRDGVAFALASCFEGKKHCVQFPKGWKSDGSYEGMGYGSIAWGHNARRSACVAAELSGQSSWAAYVKKDAAHPGFAPEQSVVVGADGVVATYRARAFRPAAEKKYPTNLLFWFGCFGAGETGDAKKVAGDGTIHALTYTLSGGASLVLWGFLADDATADEKKELFATLRGIRKAPGKLAAQP